MTENKKAVRNVIAVTIAAVYICLGVLLFFYSDERITKLTSSPDDAIQLQVYKGILFLIAALLPVFYLAGKYAKNRELSNKLEKLDKSYAEIAALFKGVFENAAAAVACIDPDGEIMDANRITLELLGYRYKELITLNLRNVIAEEEYGETQDHLKKALAGAENQWLQERQLLKKDGSSLWVNLHITAVRNTEGEITSFLIVAADISGKKAAEASLQENLSLLRKSKEQMQLVMDNVPALIAYLDESLKYRLVNAQYKSTLGIEREKIIGVHSSEILNGKIFKDVYNMYKAALDGEIIKFEMPFFIDGRRRFFKVTYLPHYFNDKIEGLFSLAVDITDLKEAEEELYKSEERFRSIFDSSIDGILVFDDGYRYLYANEAAAVNIGLPRDRLIGKTIQDAHLDQPLVSSLWKNRIDKAFKFKEPFMVEDAIVSGADTVYSESILSPIMDKSGRMFAVGVIYRDVTDRKNTEKALQTYANRLSLASKAGGTGVWELDLAANELFCDERMVEIYQFKPDEFTDLFAALNSRVHQDDFNDLKQAFDEAIERGGTFDREFRIILPDGSVRYIRSAALTELDKKGRPVSLVGVNWDITKRKIMENELRRLATKDSLTGVNNRHHFIKMAEDELHRAKRYNHPTSFLLIDIDHFKMINDTYGHPAGDEVLKALCHTCLSTLRVNDIFGRLGGEEFSVVLPEQEEQGAMAFAERLRSALEGLTVDASGDIISFTVSIGVTTSRQSDDPLDILLKQADIALYKAKNSGRNRIVASSIHSQ